MEDRKRILIVDDSEIDREILKSILENEFELIEADNGYSALEILLKRKEVFDAVLLDVSMPFLDGLSVLRILRENHLHEVAVFMITAEATKDNIEKASQYNIAEFIRKPFDREDILSRLRARLGVAMNIALSQADMEETEKYIAELERLYSRYLSFAGKDDRCDERRADFMRMLLEKHGSIGKDTKEGRFQIMMLCKAAYLCNIGNMLLSLSAQDERMDNEVYRQHTVMGADLIQLNSSRYCRRFVQICMDICMHHHERDDGRGFPHGLSGSDLSPYAQMCGLLERFDDLFTEYNRHNEVQFDYVIRQLKEDAGFVRENLLFLLEECKSEILQYYVKNYI